MLKKIIITCIFMCYPFVSEAHNKNNLKSTNIIHHHKYGNKNILDKHIVFDIQHKNLYYLHQQTGIASYYGPGFWGRHTSSGKIMMHSDMTVANKTLPLGTRLRVTNNDNGKTVIVTVNDRGPYVGNRIIDLAERPAKLLDMKTKGLANVSIMPLYVPDKNIMEVAEYEPRKTRHIKH